MSVALSAPTRSYTFGYIMSQVAGHVTNYRNLRAVAETDPTLNNVWHEVSYKREGGRIERVQDRLLFMPTYVSGVLRSTYEVRQALQSQPYDAILCNAKVGVFFSRTFRRVPTIIDLDATPLQLDRMPAYGISHDPAPLAYLKWRMAQSMMLAAAKVQVWSNWAKRSVVEEYNVPDEQVLVNPPGVDLDFWQPHSPASQATKRPRRILFVGGDFKRKGGQFLLGWFSQQSSDDYTLHIVTKEAVEPRPGVFVYSDMQPNSPELRQLYHESDVFVLPSLGECFGIANLEAMAAGLPVIATDVGGIADIIEPKRNGLIVPPGDVRALGDAITTILDDESLRTTMSSQSRQMAEERFDVRINATRTLTYLKAIANRSASL